MPTSLEELNRIYIDGLEISNRWLEGEVAQLKGTVKALLEIITTLEEEKEKHLED